jgi:MYXO-CTERM domain-containing protein
MTTQAIVERGMLESISNGVMHARYAIESRLGEGTSKWLLIGGLLLLMFFAVRRRR